MRPPQAMDNRSLAQAASGRLLLSFFAKISRGMFPLTPPRAMAVGGLLLRLRGSPDAMPNQGGWPPLSDFLVSFVGGLRKWERIAQRLV